jgi:hypothetical protein
MYMIRHNHGSMKFVTLPMIVQAVSKYGLPSLWRERLSVALAKSDEHRPSRVLVMRHLAPVIVHAFERGAKRPLQLVTLVFGFHGFIAAEAHLPCL